MNRSRYGLNPFRSGTPIYLIILLIALYIDANWLSSKRAVGEEEILKQVPNPPAIQMLVPGFTVHEVPVSLTNINNVRYRSDGRLYALGYNGNVWLLEDSDGDGMEDSAKLFFENQGRLRGPIGLAVVPDAHPLLKSSGNAQKAVGHGIVVASKGKISVLLDLDGDDIAEEERVIASGWVEIPQNVDAVGVAIHPEDGAIYFGLGVKDYNKAYQVDSDGKSHFDIQTERGTIQRIEPDLSGRRTVCTGVRFTISLAFDERGELFVSDQEGATWLANGNPFDELLHIRPSLHYGFPPRHPKHLPGVFDEPSLFDYRPQHLSTCGIAFNIPSVPDGPTIGPSDWKNDLFVCGQSRGKLYRTRLFRDLDGEYTAANQLIGCLSMLTVDCCISPRGDLLIACHSGGPDWGSGPSGQGKLFLIRYQQPESSQPVAIWPASQTEVHVEFDKPIMLETTRNLANHATVSYGEYVAAADRFESIRPGYAVTKLQQATSRYRLPVHSASISADRHTLILSTAPHVAAVSYAAQLPGLGRELVSTPDGAIAQIPEIDLAYSLSGVEVHWKSDDVSLSDWNGWLPHLDLALANQMTRGQRHSAEFWKNSRTSGLVTVKTQLDPRGLFSPTIQPGSTLDYSLADDDFVSKAAIRLAGATGFEVSIDHRAYQAALPHDRQYIVDIPVPFGSSETIPIELRMKTGGQAAWPRVLWFAELRSSQTRSGTVAIHRLLMPWAKLSATAEPKGVVRSIPELETANWGRGRKVFHGPQAGCAKCHVAHGSGEKIGPDLSNLVHRDYASVLRDVLQPSFSINPDYITYQILLDDARVLTGTLRSEGDQFSISDREGKTTHFTRNEIEEMKPSSVSTMPEGVLEKLSLQDRTDLLKFLLYRPPHMPATSEDAKPRLRRREEVAAALLGAAPANDMKINHKPLNILLVAGKKDHGPGEHDYPAWLAMWNELMSAAEAVTVSTAMEWPTNEQLDAADSIVFFQKGQWHATRAKAIDDHLARRRGLIYIHWAIEGGNQANTFAERIGLASFQKETRYRHGPLELNFSAGKDHPIARNFDRIELIDESYWKLRGDPTRIRTLGTSVEKAEEPPLFWTMDSGNGRVFVSIPGHYSSTFDDPLFRTLLLRGIAWTAFESVDRFNELITLGVELID